MTHPFADRLRRLTTLQSQRLASEQEDWIEEAKNPATPSGRLDELARLSWKRFESKKQWRKAQLAIAANPNATTKTLIGLIPKKWDDVELVDLVAKNPGRLVARLTGDSDLFELESKIAAHTNDPDVLRELAMSTDENVRADVADNKHTPADIREALAYDPDENVVTAAMYWTEDLSEATQLLRATSPSFNISLMLMKRTTSPAVIEKMVSENKYYDMDSIWVALKENPRTTRSMIQTLLDRYNGETGENITIEQFEKWKP